MEGMLRSFSSHTSNIRHANSRYAYRVQPTENGRESSWADLLTPQSSSNSQSARSLQAALPSEFTLEYDQAQKRCVLSPLDSHNVKLLDNVHPSHWTNPATDDKQVTHSVNT